MTDQNKSTDELLKLARYEVLDHRNATSDGVQALLGSLADEVERLNFIQREFHNVDDVAEIRDLKVRLREAIDIVRAKATASELEWSLEVESEIAADDVTQKPNGEKVNKPKVISGVLAVFIAMPIWYYLLYQILVRVNASELMFFLYWVYLPVAVLTSILAKVAESD